MASDPGSKFIGCIVSIRTHSKGGFVKLITGKVRSIGKTEHSITLVDGVQNGVPLPDDFTVLAEEIATLDVLTADDDGQEEVEDGIGCDGDDAKTPNGGSHQADVQQITDLSTGVSSLNVVNDNQPQYKNFLEFASAINVNNKTSTPQPTLPNGNGGGGDQQRSKKTQAPKGPQIVYSATAFENSYKPDKNRTSAFNAYQGNGNQGTDFTPSQNMLLSKLGLSGTNVQSPKSQKTDKGSRTPAASKGQNGYQQGLQAKSPRIKGNPARIISNDAFEMTVAEIKDQEFDFEENLAKFDKLPISVAPKPIPIATVPKFKSSDTTLKANRSVESVTLVNMKAAKSFTTDTGVVIPALEWTVRNSILNLANNYGLTHNITVEVFGRAVAQVCVPLLGDSYRLSPERTQDRPVVLVCTGPHWQGAAGICAARILATLGVEVILYAPKEEAMLCAKEETLFKFTGNVICRTTKHINKRRYDLVVMAMDDISAKSLSLDHSLPLQGDVVLVDPPLAESYTKSLASISNRMGAGIGQQKIVIVSPLLPLAYPADTKLKLYLVNLGVPCDLFTMNGVNYKSPFGDKLIVQFFANKNQ